MMAVMDAPDLDTDRGSADDLASAALSLARCFGAGATMWCVAGQWPAHGRHVAVEFVHPVIVGTRALPAVNIEGRDIIPTVRLLARPGDVLLVIGSADDAATAELLRRAEAWGLTRIWLGAGPRPGGGRAEHVVWLEGEDPSLASHSGDMVLLYHLLWELTHVVFEHPGLLEVPPTACTDEVCITCSDEGRVAEVRSLRNDGLVEVVIEGAYETVDATLVGPVAPGDLLLVHAGVALTIFEDARA
jgi:hydrogenase maturation factor